MTTIKPVEGIIRFIILSLFTVFMVGCASSSSNKMEMSNQSAPSSEEAIVELINNGETSFFYDLSDGYLYPVKVVSPTFLESYPLKIKANILHQQRVAALVVKKLQPAQEVKKKQLPVEIFTDNTWKETTTGHWDSNQYIAETEQSPKSPIPVPLDSVRLQSGQGEEK